MSDMLEIFHDKEQRAIEALIEIYGDDTCAVLNALHAMAARIAILTGVSPEDFGRGVKHHWDFLANAINDVQAHEMQVGK
jgi:hypothetical protein